MLPKLLKLQPWESRIVYNPLETRDVVRSRRAGATTRRGPVGSVEEIEGMIDVSGTLPKH